MHHDDASGIIAYLRHVMVDEIPFHRLLGVRVDSIEHGRARFSVPFRPELIGDSMRPALHGGVISALIDTVGGAAAWSTVGVQDRVSTIDLRVDYLLPGRSEDLIAEAWVVRAGNRVAVVAMRAYHPGEPAATVADGKGVYNIKRERPK